MKYPSPTPAEIRILREQAGWTPSQAAMACKTSYRAYVQWEAGERAMHAGTWDLMRIRAVFGIGFLPDYPLQVIPQDSPPFLRAGRAPAAPG